MTKRDHEAFLYGAMGDALPQAPEYMGLKLEAEALCRLCAQVTQMVLAGHVPITKLMTLATQALRVATEAMAEEQTRDEVVAYLLSRTVPRV